MRELSLEFEAKQPARGRMHRLSSAGSHLEHRRTSSSSTIGGMESGSASPALSLRLPTVHEPEQQQRSPAGVPLLRLPSHGGGGNSGTSSPALQLPAGISIGGSGRGGGSGGRSGGAGFGGRGMAVPRLNLGGARPLPSPGGQSTPSPGNSARQGRPPLPPSARSGMGATPRLTSRLGRATSARSGDGSVVPLAAPPPPPLAQQPPPAVPKLAVPKLGLAGVGRSLAVAAAAGAAASEQMAAQAHAAPERSHSRVHFSPTPSRLDAPSDSASGDSDSDDDRTPAAAASSSGRPTPPLGLDVPAGFTFTGDLEEDLERLEALELGEVRWLPMAVNSGACWNTLVAMPADTQRTGSMHAVA